MSETKYIPIVGHPSAGKSTLIRLLTGVKVSIGKKSGTTKKIYPFPITDQLAILDFPGYGRVTHRSKSFAEFLQQRTVDYLESIKNNILVGIVVSDLSNASLVAEKLDNKGFVPIDYELTDFIYELSQRKPIVLGNKIDKLSESIDLDEFIQFFPPEIDFFPVSLKEKIGLEPFLMYLQSICDEVLDDIEGLFWK